MRVLLLIFLACFASSFHALGQVTDDQRGDEGKQYLPFEGYFFVDSSKLMIFEEIQQVESFQKNDLPYFNFGYNPDVAFWVRVTLKNNTPYQDWRVLSFIAYFDKLDYWEETASGEWKHIRTGRSLPFASRQSDEHVGFTFSPDLPTGETRTLYFRLEGQNPMTFPLEVMRTETLSKRIRWEHLYYGFYFGTLIVMFLYNLFLFLSLRNSMYLYYILLIAASFITFSSSTGYLFKYVHPESPTIALYAVRISMGLIVIFNSLFTIRFLNLRHYGKWAYNLLVGFIILAVVAIILSVTEVRYSATNSVVSIHAVTSLALGIWIWRKSRTARYYVLAWAFYLLGGVWITLRNAGFVAVDEFTLHAVEVGSMMEVVLLSFALADRYRILKREKDNAIQKTLETQTNANRVLEMRVRERTQSLEQRNEELDQTLHTLNLQKKAIEDKNKDIRASIQTARRIQNAIMPSEATLKQNLRDVFVLNRPRDVVSGDFYYTAKENGYTILALADCTGHGVPGAFVSMMGFNLMERVFAEEQNPQKAIISLNNYMIRMLESNQHHVRESMDTAICQIDTTNKKIWFSGTKLSLVRVRKGELSTYKGAKQALGSVSVLKDVPLTEVDYEPEDRFFLFSDGYQDQFGGSGDKKFMIRRFRQLLTDT
ncbi:MAG: 7TM diverse intracellular signaling domain-containing protein, partial [Bacteroidota bacterium]